MHLLKWYLIFVFYFVNMDYHTDWFAYTELSLYPRNKSHLIMVYDPFNVLLNSVCWEFLNLYSSRILACNFLFCTVLDWLWHQSNTGWLEPGPSSSSWEVVKLLPGRNWEMHGFCLLPLHEEWPYACLKTVSLFALVPWNSWMLAMLASRGRWLGSLTLRWQPWKLRH